MSRSLAAVRSQPWAPSYVPGVDLGDQVPTSARSGAFLIPVELKGGY